MSDEEDFKAYQDFRAFQEYQNAQQSPESGYDPRSPFNRDEPTTVAPRPRGSTGAQAARAAVQGIGQGLTFGFMDELIGAVETIPRMISDGQSMGDAYASGRDESRERLAKAKEETPVLTGVSDLAGGLGGGMGLFKAMGSPNTLMGSTLFGAGEGALSSAGRSDNANEFIDNALTDIPAGAATAGLGYGAFELYNKFRRPARYNMGKRQQQAEDLGIKLSPAEQQSDQALQRFEAAQRADPGYGKAFDALDDANQEQVNRIAAETIGLKNRNRLTEDEMGEAAANISGMFNKATSKGERLDFDDQWLDDVADLEANYRKLWGKSGALPKVIDDVLDTTAKGSITPKEYQSYYSQLGKDLSQAGTAGDKHKQDLYAGLRQALDDALDRSAPGLADEMQDARNLYKNKLLLEKPGVLRTESGNVSALSLGNRLRKDVKGYLEGGNQSDLYNVARVAQGTKSGIGDSGTATRSKTPMDFITAPVKERVAQAYLSGNFGSDIFGPSTGKGGKLNPFIASLMESPEVLETIKEEEERRASLMD